MKLGEVQQVLQMLLREEVPIRQLATILETLGDYAGAHQGSRLADRIRSPSAGPHALHRVSRRREPAARGHARSGAGGSHRGGHRAQRARVCSSACRRRRSETTCQLIAQEHREADVSEHRPPVLLVSPQIRPGLKQMTAGQSAEPDRAELQRNHARHEDRIGGHRHRRDRRSDLGADARYAPEGEPLT